MTHHERRLLEQMRRSEDGGICLLGSTSGDQHVLEEHRRNMAACRSLVASGLAREVSPSDRIGCWPAFEVAP